MFALSTSLNLYNQEINLDQGWKKNNTIPQHGSDILYHPNALRNILTVHSFEIFELLCMPVGFLCYFDHSDFLCYVLTSFVVRCSVAHPYLLADNRHYPFYIWRKVITAHWSMKYLLVPLYVYSWFSVFSILG